MFVACVSFIPDIPPYQRPNAPEKVQNRAIQTEGRGARLNIRLIYKFCEVAYCLLLSYLLLSLLLSLLVVVTVVGTVVGTVVDASDLMCAKYLLIFFAVLLSFTSPSRRGCQTQWRTKCGRKSCQTYSTVRNSNELR